MTSYSEMDKISEDILREIGNIGTGNAITALSAMMGQSFKVDLPKIRIANYREVPEILGGAETLETGVMLEIDGELTGIFMFLLDENFAEIMLNAVLGEGERNLINLDEMSSSAVCEVGNVVCCSYINALAALMGLRIQVSVPDFCSDMAGAILSVPMIHFANFSEELLLIENRFSTEHYSFTAHVLFLPEFSSLEKMLKILGG